MAMVLHAVTQGALPAETPLVLLHGFGCGAFTWSPVIKRLGDAVPFIAYDLPGHGGSLDSDAIGGAGRMVKAIVADLDARGIDRFHVAGHSMGGAMAVLLALRQPERVASLALFAPGGFGPAINSRALDHYARAASEQELRRALEAMVGFNAKMPDDAVAHMLADRSRPGAYPALATIFAAMFVDAEAPLKRQGTLPVAALADLPMPIRLAWGEEDMILPVLQCGGLPNNIGVRRIAEAGHMLIDERPGEAVALIRANLA